MKRGTTTRKVGATAPFSSPARTGGPEETFLRIEENLYTYKGSKKTVVANDR